MATINPERNAFVFPLEHGFWDLVNWNLDNFELSDLIGYTPGPAHSIFHEGVKLPGWDLVTFEI